MCASRYKKDNVIILPNKDKLPIGKIKDFNKLINMVSAEYGIEDDMMYFAIQKDKHSMLFKLQYIPRGVSEIHTTNAKKFIVYELVKISHGCVMKIDEDLNKRALFINDLLNTIDDKCKETITSKLQSMFDIPGELDYLLEQLLSDPQFNSFKYTVLDSSKTSCLLCVNSSGLLIRALMPPYDVNRQLSWQDIAAIKTKGNKLVFKKKNSDEVEEVTCINKKTVVAAQVHLVKYLSFIDSDRGPRDNRRTKTSWLGSVVSRIRQSFSRRPRVPHDSEPPTSAHSVTNNKSLTGHYRENAPPNSTVPGSSVVSEDCMDNVGSMKEPSIKTNSTHDVSLGSTCSYRPGTSSLVRLSCPDDHVSVKTTSTYEVNLDTISSQHKSPSTNNGSGGGGRTDYGPMGQWVKKSPPLSQVKDSVFSDTISSSGDETVQPLAGNCEIAVVDDGEDHTRRCQIQDTKVHDPVLVQVSVEAQCPSDLTVPEMDVSISLHDQPTQSDLELIVDENDEDTEVDKRDNGDGGDGDGDGKTAEEESVCGRKSTVNDVDGEVSAQRPSKIGSGPCPAPVSDSKTPSPSNKENYNGSLDHPNDNDHHQHTSNDNFSRFENEQYVIDSQTTFTSVSSTGDSITKKFTKTEISSVKAPSSGIPTPKQYKTTTTITSTVKKSSDGGNKSPIVGGAPCKSTSGIPRMASK